MTPPRTLRLTPPPPRPSAEAWYPARLAQAAALAPSAKLIDAAAEGLSLGEVLQRSRGFSLCLLAEAPGAARAAQALREAEPALRLGLLARALAPRAALEAFPALDLALAERDLEAFGELALGRAPAEVAGLAWRDGETQRVNAPRPPSGEPPPGVLEVYRRDLSARAYRVACLRHPYLSLPAGGAPAPDPGRVLAEARRALELFPETRELYLEGDAFSGDPARAEELCRGLSRLPVAWSAEAGTRLSSRVLRAMAEGRARLLRVAFAAGAGAGLDGARGFARECRRLGLPVHGVFTLGLPGEPAEAGLEALRFACAAGLRSLSLGVADAAERPAALEALAGRLLARFYARPAPLLRVSLALARDREERRRLLSRASRWLASALRAPRPSDEGPEAAPASA